MAAYLLNVGVLPGRWIHKSSLRIDHFWSKADDGLCSWFQYFPSYSKLPSTECDGWLVPGNKCSLSNLRIKFLLIILRLYRSRSESTENRAYTKILFQQYHCTSLTYVTNHWFQWCTTIQQHTRRVTWSWVLSKWGLIVHEGLVQINELLNNCIFLCPSCTDQLRHQEKVLQKEWNCLEERATL